MQAPTLPPRNGLAEADVIALIQDSSAVTVDYGAELIDRNLNVIGDISSDLTGGSVGRASFASLHGTCSLLLSKTDIDWGNAIVRPFYTMTDGTITARFNLGAYFLSVPRQELGSTPPVFTAEGFDILLGLKDPTGNTFQASEGASYLTVVEEILVARGYTKYRIDQEAASVTLPSPRVWPTNEQTTWLTVVNDLLGSIGYQGIWSDWDGQLVVQPYISPVDRGWEWFYTTTDPNVSMIAPRRSRVRDLFEAPNRWVGVRSNNVDQVVPVEGNGMVTFNNLSGGPTSQIARGRVITKVVAIDAADQASLEAALRITIDADMRRPEKLEVSTFPNPLHWHFDRVLVEDFDSVGHVEAMVTDWRLQFSKDDMTQSWTVLDAI